MKRKIWLVLTFCLISTKAIADIGIFPQAIDFFQDSRKRSQTLNIINQSQNTQTYRVSMIEYTQDENGKYVKAETVPNSAQKYLIYSPKQFTLAPGKVQSIRVARKALNDAKDGEYVSHLAVTEVETPNMKNTASQKENEEKSDNEEVQELSITIHTLFSASIPVTIYKGENLSQSTAILSYKQNGDIIDLVLQRKGNISSRINVKVYNAKGEEIGKAGPIRIYMPNGKRNLPIHLQAGTIPSKIELSDALTNKKITEKYL